MNQINDVAEYIYALFDDYENRWQIKKGYSTHYSAIYGYNFEFLQFWSIALLTDVESLLKLKRDEGILLITNILTETEELIELGRKQDKNHNKDSNFSLDLATSVQHLCQALHKIEDLTYKPQQYLACLSFIYLKGFTVRHNKAVSETPITELDKYKSYNEMYASSAELIFLAQSAIGEAKLFLSISQHEELKTTQKAINKKMQEEINSAKGGRPSHSCGNEEIIKKYIEKFHKREITGKEACYEIVKEAGIKMYSSKLSTYKSIWLLTDGKYLTIKEAEKGGYKIQKGS